MQEMGWTAETTFNEYWRLSEAIGDVENEVMYAQWMNLVEAYKNGDSFDTFMEAQ